MSHHCPELIQFTSSRLGALSFLVALAFARPSRKPVCYRRAAIRSNWNTFIKTGSCSMKPLIKLTTKRRRRCQAFYILALQTVGSGCRWFTLSPAQLMKRAEFDWYQVCKSNLEKASAQQIQIISPIAVLSLADCCPARCALLFCCGKKSKADVCVLYKYKHFRIHIWLYHFEVCRWIIFLWVGVLRSEWFHLLDCALAYIHTESYI